MRAKVAVAVLVTTWALPWVGQEIVGGSSGFKRAFAAPANTAKTTFAVAGMTCPSCTVTVRIALKKVDGIKDAKVDVPNGQITVDYDSTKITPDQIAEAINKLGYKASMPEKKS